MLRIAFVYIVFCVCACVCVGPYPGEHLTPFPVEMPGPAGAESRFWLLSDVRQLPQEM